MAWKNAASTARPIISPLVSGGANNSERIQWFMCRRSTKLRCCRITIMRVLYFLQMRRRWGHGKKKCYLIYFSHLEFISVAADGEGAEPGQKQTSGSTAGAVTVETNGSPCLCGCWQRHQCVHIIEINSFLSQMTDPKLSACTLNTTEVPPNVHVQKHSAAALCSVMIINPNCFIYIIFTVLRFCFLTSLTFVSSEKSLFGIKKICL